MLNPSPPPDFAQVLRGRDRIGWDNCRALLAAGRKMCALSEECPDVADALKGVYLSDESLRMVRGELQVRGGLWLVCTVSTMPIS